MGLGNGAKSFLGSVLLAPGWRLAASPGGAKSYAHWP
jgi:hypothetical protein